MQKQVDERVLVNQILKGEGKAARQLYKLVEQKLSSFFIAKVAQEEDVDELVQDTFLHLLDALPLFRFQSSITTFAVSIAQHELADYWRKRYAKRLIKTVPMLGQYHSSTGSLYNSEMVSKAMNRAVERAYASIKPIQAQLLRWKYEEGWSVKEMAAELGWSDKAVETQLYRARKAFQAVYVEPEVYE